LQAHPPDVAKDDSGGYEDRSLWRTVAVYDEPQRGAPAVHRSGTAPVIVDVMAGWADAALGIAIAAALMRAEAALKREIPTLPEQPPSPAHMR
jgi:hypothetical protein